MSTCVKTAPPCRRRRRRRPPGSRAGGMPRSLTSSLALPSWAPCSRPWPPRSSCRNYSARTSRCSRVSSPCARRSSSCPCTWASEHSPAASLSSSARPPPPLVPSFKSLRRHLRSRPHPRPHRRPHRRRHRRRLHPLGERRSAPVCSLSSLARFARRSVASPAA